jgi:hypothetical protein
VRGAAFTHPPLNTVHTRLRFQFVVVVVVICVLCDELCVRYSCLIHARSWLPWLAAKLISMGVNVREVKAVAGAGAGAASGGIAMVAGLMSTPQQDDGAVDEAELSLRKEELAGLQVSRCCVVACCLLCLLFVVVDVQRDHLVLQCFKFAAVAISQRMCFTDGAGCCPRACSRFNDRIGGTA